MIRATISEIGRWFLPHEVDQGRPERILQEADQLDLVSAQFHFFITFESKSNSVFIYENEDVYRWIWPSRGSACTFYRVPRPGQYDKSATDGADIERIQRLRPTTKLISNFSTIFSSFTFCMSKSMQMLCKCLVLSYTGRYTRRAQTWMLVIGNWFDL